MFVNNIRYFLSPYIHAIIDPIVLYSYRIKLPQRVRVIRKKEKIKVLFIVSEIASWKTELLYNKMLLHSRFQPVLGVSTSYGPPNVKQPLIDYLKSKNYNFVDLDLGSNSIKNIAPDIIFYYKPYGICYSMGHFFDCNKDYVFCGMNYCFSTAMLEHHVNIKYFDYCWLYFVEHNEIAQYRKKILGYRANNTRVTGVPMQDVLNMPKTSFPDPWRDKSGKKRIIYAPHHSIKGTNGSGVEFATFLEVGEDLLSLAKKYSNKVVFAFKPHPTLYMKLVEIWGEERTNSYYNEWSKLPGMQIETGEYLGLFKYSDAIIHDCSSFILEYLYMDKPGMYLVADTNNIDDMYKYVQEAFYCYEHGRTIVDIETFIIDIINNCDKMSNKRRDYIHNNLLPPFGHSACENIMNSILGV